MGAVMEMEPRTSMERHLLDRDRDGQLYLEARRRQAAEDLLQNRTSFLSTITPPSTATSSAASSLFNENMTSAATSHCNQAETTHQSNASPLPSTPLSPAARRALLAPVQNIPPKKARLRPGSAKRGRSSSTVTKASAPLKPILPSSLEYQLTASLLKSLDSNSHHTRNRNPNSNSNSTTARAHRRSRSYSRSYAPPQQTQTTRPRHGTISSDASPHHPHLRQPLAITPQYWTRDRTASGDSNNRDKTRGLMQNTGGCTIAELTPTSILGSIPSSPVDVQTPSHGMELGSSLSIPLPPVPPSPPLPPLPPKSPRSLIAQYFPGSLPPPPARDRSPYGHREPLVAPTPFKTPTFGPATTIPSDDAPPMPSPSTSCQYIPSANASSATPNHLDDMASTSDTNNRPSPCTSAFGHFHPMASSSTTSSGKVQQQQHSALFLPVQPRSSQKVPVPAISAPSRSSTPPLQPATLAHQHHHSHQGLLYPKGLLPQNPPPDRFSKPAVVPYVSELFTTHSSTTDHSTHTSREIELVVEGLTGRLQTNRTSVDPWPYSPWDAKPLPPIRRERGDRYWVFRDQNGLVPGPFLFLLGHVCPILWWIGSVYPTTRHPSNPSKDVTGRNDGPSLRKRAHHWVQAQWSARGHRKPGPRGRTSLDGDLEEHCTNGTAGISSSEAKVSQVRVAIPSRDSDRPPLGQEEDLHGPWASDDHASSLFEQRMEYNRKVLRYELDVRWRQINQIWSISSFVLAIAITAVIIATA
ncbi:hypothetical protein BGZ94_004510 [Podila epigama]|nr:hypothetical protein BGZ94_004510 [Podila epigama]